MNHSLHTKTEICQSSLPQKDCCHFAFLCGLCFVAGQQKDDKSNNDLKIIIHTENQFLPPFVSQITIDLFDTISEYNLSKITIEGQAAQEVLKVKEQVFLPNDRPYILKSDCCKRAFITAAFLGCGHISVYSGYHLEFILSTLEIRNLLQNLFLGYGIKTLTFERNDKYLLYLKDKDLISDVLALMGATKAVLSLNSLMAERSLKQKISRTANCDMANLNRLVKASVLQQQAIKKLKKIDNPKLKETAQARLDNPDLSYEQLASLLGISKGALKYRLNKLVALAAKEEKNE